MAPAHPFIDALEQLPKRSSKYSKNKKKVKHSRDSFSRMSDHTKDAVAEFQAH